MKKLRILFYGRFLGLGDVIMSCEYTIKGGEDLKIQFLDGRHLRMTIIPTLSFHALLETSVLRFEEIVLLCKTVEQSF
jgi:hypothetical protein